MSISLETSQAPILLIAESCNPEMTSVPLVSWFYFIALRNQVPVHLVTQVRNKNAIERQGLIEGQDFTAIDSEAIARRTWQLSKVLRGGANKGWTTVIATQAFAYYYFEHLLWKRFRADLKNEKYMLVHRLTPLSPTVPSLLATRCAKSRIPFILGPMNGGLPWPKQFRNVQRREREWLSSVRYMSRLMPYWRSTYKKATAVVSGSRDTWRQLASVVGGQHVYMPRNGVDVNVFEFSERPGVRGPARPLELLFVGRLVPYKGVDMVLEAAAKMLQDGRARLTIVGEGPQQPELTRIVESNDLHGVSFVGQVPHSQIYNYFKQADLFVFPSIREFGGAVILEAMACGVPPVVVDYGGPGELASPSTGVLVPLGSREKIVEVLRRELESLESNRSRIGELASAARKRVVDEFDWPSKARQLVSIYGEIIKNYESKQLNTRSEQLVSCGG